MRSSWSQLRLIYIQPFKYLLAPSCSEIRAAGVKTSFVAPPPTSFCSGCRMSLAFGASFLATLLLGLTDGAREINVWRGLEVVGFKEPLGIVKCRDRKLEWGSTCRTHTVPLVSRCKCHDIWKGGSGAPRRSLLPSSV